MRRFGAALAGLGIAGAWLVAAAAAQSATQARADGMTRELAESQRRTRQLERRLELARGRDFYLTIDPAGGTVTLMLRGAGLQQYPILGLQVGRPRVSWVRRGRGIEWQDVIWSGGELDPPRPLDRLVVRAGDASREGDDPKPPAIPPTAEELYPVPSRYHIRFKGGLSLEIRPHEADASVGRLARLAAWWTAKWRDVWAATVSAEGDAIRLRVVLHPKDAASLYRALPPSTRLLVVAGGGTPR
ncbi:MAG: hypothetical protein AB1806_01225 [Acidobacteriota bacterium]